MDATRRSMTMTARDIYRPPTKIYINPNPYNGAVDIWDTNYSHARPAEYIDATDAEALRAALAKAIGPL